MRDTLYTRRSSLALGAGAFLVGTSAAFARTAVAFPETPLELERTLVRGLSDGASITVTRRWKIAFQTNAGGAVLHGEQTAVSVDAPPALAALAQMEQRRDESGFLPLTLGPEGLITEDVTERPFAPLPAEAMREALAYAHDRASGEAPRKAVRAFLADLNGAKAQWLSRLPRDLFFPRPGRQVIERDVPLPDGGNGTMTLVLEAIVDPSSSLLRTFSREAITRVSDSQRTSSETWRIV